MFANSAESRQQAVAQGALPTFISLLRSSHHPQIIINSNRSLHELATDNGNKLEIFKSGAQLLWTKLQQSEKNLPNCTAAQAALIRGTAGLCLANACDSAACR
jgi:hypothetical protein